MVWAQGGDVSFIEAPERLPQAPLIEVVGAPHAGTLATILAREVGLTVVEMGGGRARKGEPIDPSVGVRLLAKVGDSLLEGAPLFELHAASETSFRAARARLLEAFVIGEGTVQTPPLFHDVISSRQGVGQARFIR